jgi:hypothetical protein
MNVLVICDRLVTGEACRCHAVDGLFRNGVVIIFFEVLKNGLSRLADRIRIP